MRASRERIGQAMSDVAKGQRRMRVGAVPRFKKRRSVCAVRSNVRCADSVCACAGASQGEHARQPAIRAAGRCSLRGGTAYASGGHADGVGGLGGRRPRRRACSRRPLARQRRPCCRDGDEPPLYPLSSSNENLCNESRGRSPRASRSRATSFAASSPSRSSRSALGCVQKAPPPPLHQHTPASKKYYPCAPMFPRA